MRVGGPTDHLGHQFRRALRRFGMSSLAVSSPEITLASLEEDGRHHQDIGNSINNLAAMVRDANAS
jgi:hypothetical protein